MTDEIVEYKQICLDRIIVFKALVLRRESRRVVWLLRYAWDAQACPVRKPVTTSVIVSLFKYELDKVLFSHERMLPSYRFSLEYLHMF